jgi:hypothetical protein
MAETMICRNPACGRRIGVQYVRAGRPGRGRSEPIPRARVPRPHKLPTVPGGTELTTRDCPNGRPR